MSESHDQEIRFLRNQYWSARDPEGRAFVPLADAYRRKGDLAEAASLVDDGVGRLPDFASGHLVAAFVARDRGASGEARRHLDRVLELDSQNVTALMERADLAIEAGERDVALLDLRELLRLEPGHGEARERLAEAEREDVMEAVPVESLAPPVVEIETEPEAEIEAEIEVEPLLPAPSEDRLLRTRTMGEIYARQGLVARAIEVYEHLISAHPGDPDLLARLQELRGRGSEEDGEAREEVVPSPTPASGRPIAAYFEDLLAWIPGAVPIGSLAPDFEASTEASAEPSDPREEAPLALEATAPLAEAAPEPLAPEETPESEPNREDDEMDEFRSWLEGLQ